MDSYFPLEDSYHNNYKVNEREFKKYNSDIQKHGERINWDDETGRRIKSLGFIESGSKAESRTLSETREMLDWIKTRANERLQEPLIH
ncbi:hypothetical protein JP09_000765 [Dehalogenimonas etheniformans]|uniref:Uncharacterized protein n=1 Tax=Dehalogenimonas etheniformans TaxID=1536648 RepID=A0A2P5P9Z0_9CHLR|nr:hypothetical protein JP09_000765 [Dehalogenimonas etheniformans]